MLAKYVIFFFALAASVKAAPVVDYRPLEVRGLNKVNGPDPIKLNPLARNNPNNQPLPVNNQPLPVNNQPLPVNTQPQPVNNQPLPVNKQPLPKGGTSLDILHLFDLLKRASVDADLDADGGASIALPPSRRWITPADTRSYQISDVTFDEIPQGQGEVSNDNGDNLPGSKRSFGINGANYGDNGWPIPTKVIHNVIPRPTNNRPRP